MQNIYLAGRSAIAFLLSNRMKEFDTDYEISQYVSRQSSNFMAYLEGVFSFPSFEAIGNEPPIISHSEVSSLSDALGVPAPLQVHVPSLQTRRNSGKLSCSVHPECVMRGAYFEVDQGLWCSRPELVLLDEAKQASDLELIVLMSLFFGIFAKGVGDSEKLQPRRSLLSKEQLESFLDDCASTGERLSNRAYRLKGLLPYAVQKAASPKEIECALRLCLDAELGGCALKGAQMNYRIDITGASYARYCDLYWPERNVAVEYDSEQEHASVEALEKDALHCNDLAVQGVPVIHITPGQLRDIGAFNHVVGQLAFLLGDTRPKGSGGFRERQLRLKNDLDAAFKRYGF